jgi:hypothetical protein
MGGAFFTRRCRKERAKMYGQATEKTAGNEKGKGRRGGYTRCKKNLDIRFSGLGGIGDRTGLQANILQTMYCTAGGKDGRHGKKRQRWLYRVSKRDFTGHD